MSTENPPAPNNRRGRDGTGRAEVEEDGTERTGGHVDGSPSLSPLRPTTARATSGDQLYNAHTALQKADKDHRRVEQDPKKSLEEKKYYQARRTVAEDHLAKIVDSITLRTVLVLHTAEEAKAFKDLLHNYFAEGRRGRLKTVEISDKVGSHTKTKILNTLESAGMKMNPTLSFKFP
ncbi:hypothetical protein NL676_016138 [Syzygium grande]|nr:hypothetical protein NL676_016138 [Syzygium grande]